MDASWFQEQIRKEREERKKDHKYVSRWENQLRPLLKDLNFNPERAELLTCGFLHEWNKQNIQTTNCIIPEELIQTFCKFYPIDDITWNTEIKGHGIDFTKDNKQATFEPHTVMRYWCGKASLFVNKIISDKMCKRFEIKYVHNGDLNISGFGYIPTSAFYKFDVYQALGDNGQQLGEDESVGLFLRNSKLEIITGDGFGNIKLDAKSLNDLNTDDKEGIIGLLFDFENDALEIYHDDTFVNKLGLDGHKSIIPAFTFAGAGSFSSQALEIKECNFYQ